MHPLWGLALAIWGAIVFAVTYFNPGGWGDLLYRVSKNVSRIGPMRMGIFAFSDDPILFRVVSACIGLALLVWGIVAFVT